MSLRFFADHCVSNYVIETLIALGHEAFRLRDYLPNDSPDPVVLAQAQTMNTILISLNGDFADIVTYPPANYQGIVSLQIRNHPEMIPQILSRFQEYLSVNPEMAHYQGKLFLVEVHRIRIRQ